MPVNASHVLDRVLVLEMVRVTEAAAVAASKLVGRGDEKAADHAAVEAMREALNQLELDGTVVIGEGERDEAPMLYIGEKVGAAQGRGPKIDIALDPLEGTTITAKAGANALAVLAIAEQGCLLNAPDVYMEKLAVGPGYPDGVIDLSRSPSDNIRSVAAAKGVEPSDIIVCVLDRPRHAGLIAELRGLGCGIALIPDGDVAGVIAVTDPDTTIDVYMGQGGSALRRWAVPGPARVPQRRRARPSRQMGRDRPGADLSSRGAGERRRDLRRHRRDRRHSPPGGQAAKELSHHRERGHARLHRHRPLGPGRAPPRAGVALRAIGGRLTLR
jgi:Bacterial fructose-1,6-bisphosphatase, glpX-encoded